MKRRIRQVLSFSVVFLFLLSGCFFHYTSYQDETQQVTMDVYNCLLEGDKEKLKGLFSEYAQNDPLFDQKVDDFMNAIGGKIVSGDVDKYHYDVGCRERNVGTPAGEYDYLQAVGKIDNVTDANNYQYEMLWVSYIYRDTADPDHMGVFAICVSDDPNHVFYIISPEYPEPKRESSRQDPDRGYLEWYGSGSEESQSGLEGYQSGSAE